MNLRKSLEERLQGAGYHDRGEGVFERPNTRRTIALIDAEAEPGMWPERLDILLRKDALRHVPTWSRYALFLVNARKTPQLAIAAAAFCRDVSKCRRLVAFADQTPQQALPFLGLTSVPGGGGTPVHDLEAIARQVLGANDICTAFLDVHVPLAQVQKLAEESGE